MTHILQGSVMLGSSQPRQKMYGVGDDEKSIYHQARKEAYKLMSRDSFHRFVREDEYQALDRDRERKRDRDLFVCLSALSICLSIYIELSICRSVDPSVSI